MPSFYYGHAVKKRIADGASGCRPDKAAGGERL